MTSNNLKTDNFYKGLPIFITKLIPDDPVTGEPRDTMILFDMVLMKEEAYNKLKPPIEKINIHSDEFISKMEGSIFNSDKWLRGLLPKIKKEPNKDEKRNDG